MHMNAFCTFCSSSPLRYLRLWSCQDSCCCCGYVYLCALTRALVRFALYRCIIYLDETWVNAGHTKEYVWQDTTVKSSQDAFLKGLTTGLAAPSGKGARLILVHAGSSATGFVEGAADYFRAKKGAALTTTLRWMADTLRNGSPTSFCQTFRLIALLSWTMRHTTA